MGSIRDPLREAGLGWFWFCMLIFIAATATLVWPEKYRVYFYTLFRPLP